jgi:hypothetical protein
MIYLRTMITCSRMSIPHIHATLNLKWKIQQNIPYLPLRCKIHTILNLVHQMCISTNYVSLVMPKLNHLEIRNVTVKTTQNTQTECHEMEPSVEGSKDRAINILLKLDAFRWRSKFQLCDVRVDSMVLCRQLSSHIKRYFIMTCTEFHTGLYM